MQVVRRAAFAAVVALPAAALVPASATAQDPVRSDSPARRCAGCDSAQLAAHRAELVNELARIRAEIPRLERQVAQARDASARRELVTALQSLQQRNYRLRSELQEAMGRARWSEGRSARVQVFAPRGYIGLNLEGSVESRGTPTAWTTRYIDFPEIVSVEPGSPAERAGIRTGDILLAVNGIDAKAPEFASQLTESLRPGNELVLRLRRGGGVHTIAARVEARPANFREFTVVHGAPMAEGVQVHVFTPAAPRPGAVGAATVVAAPPAPPAMPAAPEGPAPAPAPVVASGGVNPSLAPRPIAISRRSYSLAGAELLAVNVELARTLGADRAGLWVLNVGPQTPASRSGLRTGDLIVGLPAADVATIERLQVALRGDGRRGVELGVMRDGEPVSVTLRW